MPTRKKPEPSVRGAGARAKVTQAEGGNGSALTEAAIAHHAKLLADIADELRTVNENLIAENLKRDKRIKTNQHLTRITGAFAVIACLVGALGIAGAFNAREAAHNASKALAVTTSDERGSLRANACEQYNRQQDAGIAGDEGQIDAFLDLLAAGATPENRAKAAMFVANARPKIRANAVAAHPKRDCSPAGIATYLAP